jgi:hypothetical protein
MGLEHEDNEVQLQSKRVPSLITSIYKYLALRLAIGGSVGLLLSILLCVDGIYQDFNLELWIFTGIFMFVSLVVAFFSWRWLFLHRGNRVPEASAADPRSIKGAPVGFR